MKLNHSTIALIALCTATLWGCGGGSTASGVPEGYTAVTVTAGGGVADTISHSLVNTSKTLKDAFSQAIGDGSGGNAKVIFDSSYTYCKFFDSATAEDTQVKQTTGSSIEVIVGTLDSSDGNGPVDQEQNCTDLNKCITLNIVNGNPDPTDSNGQPDCSVSGSGTVPSNVVTDEDSFDVTLVFYSTAKTDADGDLTVRYDIAKSNLYADPYVNDWPEIDLDYGFDETGCAGGTGSGQMTAQFESANYGADETHKLFRVNTVDKIDGLATCYVTHTNTSTFSLNGANDGVPSISLDRGSITLGTKVCDYKDPTVQLPDDSVCTGANTN